MALLVLVPSSPSRPSAASAAGGRFFRAIYCTVGATRYGATVLRYVASGLLLVLGACAGVREDLRHAESAFVEARYEEVNTWLADLTSSVPEMPRPMRARYYYMAGVTAFRLGRRERALHNLRLCREEVSDPSARLTEERMRNLELTLAELE